MLRLSIKPDYVQRVLKGYPWVYTHGIVPHKSQKVQPGELVYLTEGNNPFAIAYYNPNSKLACRVLSWDPTTEINQDFFQQQFTKALLLRQQLFSEPFYRLVHAEGDNLPGLVIDRFDDTLVCQTTTAGMEKLKFLWLPVLQDLLRPSTVIFRDDSPSRKREGLTIEITAPIGKLQEAIPMKENNIIFYADPQYGQKTGWFYDQRANRHWVAQQSQHKSVLDLYTYSGGFGISAACHGASQVMLVDSSQTSLALAERAASANEVLPSCQFMKENVFTLLSQFIADGKTFDVVIADPPAFVKQAHHKGSGLRGYQKLAKLASQVVTPGGLLFIASCSHHAAIADFNNAVKTGVSKANRIGTILRKAGADKDHPVHPRLPENQYLKSLALQINSL